MRRIPMPNREEERLKELKLKINEREYPERAIDEAIRMGIQKANRSKKPSYLWKTALAASLIFLVLFISSLRVSETFASYVSNIPGMEQIVEMVRQDKGMVSVIDNDFVQEVNNSAAHQGITITLNSFIADQEQLVLFYNVDSSSSSFENLRIDKIQVVDEYGEEVAFDSLSIDAIDSKEEDMYQSNYGLKETLNKENYTMEIELSNGDAPLGDTWEIPFKVNQNKVGKTKDIHLNQEFLVEGQKILVKTIKASPTRVGIQMEFSSENTKRIFDIEDLRLVDENGETWSRISNGLSASGDFEEKTYYLQSNYFENPKELYLVFSKIRALEKDKLEVKVDTEELKILRAPDERLAKVEYEEIYDETGALLFSWDVRYEQANHMSPIQSYKDAGGEEHKLSSQYHEGGGSEGLPRFGFPYDRDKVSGVITFELQDYPSWIEGEVKIPVEQ
ncbi:DUF4179 domain-containing protein [Rossellomorea vietnamensis]|uniref:DUF4179 domain-containing protein n=2 Tax=Rossellomorea vietnamensis TaxID=218284 RepID=A0A5D4KK12_9BACI|nr:DUF4179 domain-containing protein [Rossellomorea vietnamensis]